MKFLVKPQCSIAVSIVFSVKAECAQSTNQMTSYFQNPGWPSASQDRLICTLTVDLQANVKQVLLDFVSFEVRIFGFVSNSEMTTNCNFS